MSHIGLFLALIWLFAVFNLSYLGLHIDSFANVVLFSAEMYFLGGLLGGMVMGFYLLSNNRLFRLHSNDVMSAQAIPDYKHFLRLRRTAEGDLYIYAIALDKVPRWPKGWSLNRDRAAEGKSWFDPASGPPLEERMRLVEPPVRVPGRETGGQP